MTTSLKLVLLTLFLILHVCNPFVYTSSNKFSSLVPESEYLKHVPRDLLMISNKNKKRRDTDTTGGTGRTGFTNRVNLDALKSSPTVFVNGIRTRSKDAVELSYNERTDLSTLINMHVNGNMKPATFASLISSISNLKHVSKTWDCTNEIKILIDAIPTRGAIYSGQDISMIFVAFAQLELSYNETIARNAEFLLTVANLLQDMNERAVGDVLWGLGSTGAKWSRLPSQLQRSILDAISRHSPSFRFFR